MAELYRIKKNTIGSKTIIPISAAEFREITHAVDNLARVIDIEEAYDILINNYVDYEKAVAGILIEEEVHNRFTDHAFHKDRRHMSRMIANLLSSALFFQDLTDKVVPKVLGRRALAELREERERIAEGSFYYRFMEALRNHSQHEHFAVTSLSFGAQWLEHGDELKATRVHTFTPSVAPKFMSAFPRFQGLLAEYKSMRAGNPDLPKAIDLTLCVRSYVMSLGDVLMYVRKMLGDRSVVVEWQAVIDRWLEAFMQASSNESLIAVMVQHVREDQDGERTKITVLEERHLGGELGKTLARLEKQNRKLVNLHRIQFRT